VPAYFAHVDGLRALAVLAVMLYHLHPAALPGGFVGVDVFFVVSGYVVTASLAGHRSEGAGDFLARFYARRLARLVPALVTMLVVATALTVLFVPKAWFNRAAETTGQAAFWGLSNWSLDRQVINYFEPRAELNPFTHTWSLGVEEQFYLIAPLLLFVALGQHFSGRRRFIGTIGIAVLALLSLAACYYFGLTRGARFVFYQITFRFWELAAGVLLYLLGSRVGRLSAGAAGFYQLSGWLGLLLVALAMGLPKPTAYPWIRSTLAVLGTVLLIGLPGIERRDRLRPLLSSRPALWVGLRSYSLYLWHWPVYVLARWTTGLSVWPFNLIAVALSFAAAAACYRAIENPVRHSATLKRWRPRSRIAIFGLVLGLGWLAGHTLLAQQPALGLGQPTRQAADWYADRHLLKDMLAARRQCDPLVRHAAVGPATDALTIFLPEACPMRAPAQLFVIGDSHATAYLPMLEQLSAEQGREVKVLQVPGCAYLDLNAPLTPEADPHCHRMAQAAMQTVLQHAHRGDLVFLPSLRIPRLIELGGSPPSQDAGDRYGHTPQALEGIHRATADAPHWLNPLLDAGLQVFFELPKPVFAAHAFQCVDWFNRNNPDCRGGLTTHRADQERYRAPVVAAIRHLASTLPGVGAWDPLPMLCTAPACGAMRDGRPLFFDGDHVSPYGNAALSRNFGDAVSRLAAQATPPAP
jgi:peptidoglycan/LPS O-acetylase OafA/YrhL